MTFNQERTFKIYNKRITKGEALYIIAAYRPDLTAVPSDSDSTIQGKLDIMGSVNVFKEETIKTIDNFRSTMTSGPMFNGPVMNQGVMPGGFGYSQSPMNQMGNGMMGNGVQQMIHQNNMMRSGMQQMNNLSVGGNCMPHNMMSPMGHQGPIHQGPFMNNAVMPGNFLPYNGMVNGIHANGVNASSPFGNPAMEPMVDISVVQDLIRIAVESGAKDITLPFEELAQMLIEASTGRPSVGTITPYTREVPTVTGSFGYHNGAAVVHGMTPAYQGTFKSMEDILIFRMIDRDSSSVIIKSYKELVNKNDKEFEDIVGYNKQLMTILISDMDAIIRSNKCYNTISDLYISDNKVMLFVGSPEPTNAVHVIYKDMSINSGVDLINIGRIGKPAPHFASHKTIENDRYRSIDLTKQMSEWIKGNVDIDPYDEDSKPVVSITVPGPMSPSLDNPVNVFKILSDYLFGILTSKHIKDIDHADCNYMVLTIDDMKYPLVWDERETAVNVVKHTDINLNKSLIEIYAAK